MSRNLKYLQSRGFPGRPQIYGGAKSTFVPIGSKSVTKWPKRCTYKQTNKQTNKQTDRQTDTFGNYNSTA